MAIIYLSCLTDTLKHYYSEKYPEKYLRDIQNVIRDGLTRGEKVDVLIFEGDGDEHFKFIEATALILMDMKVPLRMAHPEKYFISYAGTKHIINQMTTLQKHGYVLEHTFAKNNGDYISQKNRVDNMPPLKDYCPMKYIKAVKEIFK
ncbi:hypothetical protein [Nonlabens ulvanivorans]|uniref:hypothetical protein n=1 Tax=Nonlabens ulvanivorans TaxID=906888 RepID=UPI003296B807